MHLPDEPSFIATQNTALCSDPLYSYIGTHSLKNTYRSLSVLYFYAQFTHPGFDLVFLASGQGYPSGDGRPADTLKVKTELKDCCSHAETAYQRDVRCPFLQNDRLVETPLHERIIDSAAGFGRQAASGVNSPFCAMDISRQAQSRITNHHVKIHPGGHVKIPLQINKITAAVLNTDNIGMSRKFFNRFWRNWCLCHLGKIVHRDRNLRDIGNR